MDRSPRLRGSFTVDKYVNPYTFYERMLFILPRHGSAKFNVCRYKRGKIHFITPHVCSESRERLSGLHVGDARYLRIGRVIVISVRERPQRDVGGTSDHLSNLSKRQRDHNIYMH